VSPVHDEHDPQNEQNAHEHEHNELREADLAALDRRLAALRIEQASARRESASARRRMWLAHHWPQDYHERCFRLGSRPVCRRCGALYPLSFVVAAASVAGRPPWPPHLDPWLVWLLSVPATVAYVGEALGWFRYRARWQVAGTLLAALAFGRALGYELVDRWSPVFWGPIAVFGGIWFAATLIGSRQRHHSRTGAAGGAASRSTMPRSTVPQSAVTPNAVPQSAATASSSSSSVL
jgi:hypothetical protein